MVDEAVEEAEEVLVDEEDVLLAVELETKELLAVELETEVLETDVDVLLLAEVEETLVVVL